MITPFYGEFLHHPAPLELSLDSCGYGCQYCFARTRGEKKPFSIRSVTNLFRDMKKRDTLEAHLLRAGYPVCLSNRTDPFCHGNAATALGLLEVMEDIGTRVYLQTKGGPAAFEAAEIIRPSVWYITITTTDKATLRRIEPGAPSYNDRLALIRHLTSLGHSVELGINPLVPEWVGDVEALIRDGVAAGAKGVYIRSLHFNRRNPIPSAMVEAMGEAVVERAKSKTMDAAELELFSRSVSVCDDLGVPYDSELQLHGGDFAGIAASVYERTFPALLAFKAACYANPNKYAYTFREFWDWASPHLPDGTHRLQSYIGSTAHQMLKTHDIPSRMTFKTLMKIIWSDPRHPRCPARSREFALLATDDSVVERRGGHVTSIVDDEDLPVLVFMPSGVETNYIREGDIK